MGNKELTTEYIKKMVTTDRSWTERAVAVIYEFQTADEQRTGETKHNNKVGFSGPDAYIMSEFARWLISGRHLSQKQLALAQKRIGKYAGQLLKIARTNVK